MPRCFQEESNCDSMLQLLLLLQRTMVLSRRMMKRSMGMRSTTMLSAPSGPGFCTSQSCCLAAKILYLDFACVHPSQRSPACVCDHVPLVVLLLVLIQTIHTLLMSIFHYKLKPHPMDAINLVVPLNNKELSYSP